MKKKKDQVVRFEWRKRSSSSAASFCQFKESKQAVNSMGRLVEGDDDEDVEKVNWSGEPVGSEMFLLTTSGERRRVIGCQGDVLPRSPQVSLGQSEKQKYPIRGQRESPPSLRVLLIGRASARVPLATL